MGLYQHFLIVSDDIKCDPKYKLLIPGQISLPWKYYVNFCFSQIFKGYLRYKTIFAIIFLFEDKLIFNFGDIEIFLPMVNPQIQLPMTSL